MKTEEEKEKILWTIILKENWIKGQHKIGRERSGVSRVH